MSKQQGGPKRPSEPGQHPTSRKTPRSFANVDRKPFRPSPDELAWLKANSLPALVRQVLPKGHMTHSIQVDFGECPRKLNEILKKIEQRDMYPKATSHLLHAEKALLDVGFPMANLADQAQRTTFKVGEYTLPCIRTRSPLDISICIRLDSLPTTVGMATL